MLSLLGYKSCTSKPSFGLFNCGMAFAYIQNENGEFFSLRSVDYGLCGRLTSSGEDESTSCGAEGIVQDVLKGP